MNRSLQSRATGRATIAARPLRRPRRLLDLGAAALGRQAAREHLGDAVAAHRDAVEPVGGLHRALLVGDHDELRAIGVAAQQRQEAIEVEVVERRLDLVEDVEGAGPRKEDREQEGERRHRLLTAGQQRQALGRLAGRRDLDLDAQAAPRSLARSASASASAVAPRRRRSSPRRARRPRPAGSGWPPSTARGVCSSLTSRSRPEPPGNTSPTSSSKLRAAACECLLEGLLDLAVGVADQGAQLAQRRLEVRALALDLLDVRDAPRRTPPAPAG